MSDEKERSDSEEISILSILQQIKEGVRDPSNLTVEDRRRCVEALKFQNQSVVQIAWLLKFSEKTISRDIAAIRKKNAMSPSTEWAKEFVGELDAQAQAQIGRLTRIATSGDCKPEDRINAEALIWKIHKEHTEAMQTLGYLPSVPRQIVADLFHHGAEGEGCSIEDLKKKVAELISLVAGFGTPNPQFEEKIKMLEFKIRQLELEQEVASAERLAEEETSHE